MTTLKPYKMQQIKGLLCALGGKRETSRLQLCVRYICLTASFEFHPHRPFGACPSSSLVPPLVFWKMPGQTFLPHHPPRLRFPSQRARNFFKATSNIVHKYINIAKTTLT